MATITYHEAMQHFPDPGDYKACAIVGCLNAVGLTKERDRFWMKEATEIRGPKPSTGAMADEGDAFDKMWVLAKCIGWRRARKWAARRSRELRKIEKRKQNRRPT